MTEHQGQSNDVHERKFYFTEAFRPIHWPSIDKALNDGDISNTVPDVLYGRIGIEKEGDVATRVAQLSAQYLFHCQNVLKSSCERRLEMIESQKLELQKLHQKFEKGKEKKRCIKRELKNIDAILSKYDTTLHVMYPHLAKLVEKKSDGSVNLRDHPKVAEFSDDVSENMKHVPEHFSENWVEFMHWQKKISKWKKEARETKSLKDKLTQVEEQLAELEKFKSESQYFMMKQNPKHASPALHSLNPIHVDTTIGKARLSKAYANNDGVIVGGTTTPTSFGSNTERSSPPSLEQHSPDVEHEFSEMTDAGKPLEFIVDDRLEPASDRESSSSEDDDEVLVESFTGPSHRQPTTIQYPPKGTEALSPIDGSGSSMASDERAEDELLSTKQSSKDGSPKSSNSNTAEATDHMAQEDRPPIRDDDLMKAENQPSHLENSKSRDTDDDSMARAPRSVEDSFDPGVFPSSEEGPSPRSDDQEHGGFPETHSLHEHEASHDAVTENEESFDPRATFHSEPLHDEEDSYSNDDFEDTKNSFKYLDEAEDSRGVDYEISMTDSEHHPSDYVLQEVDQAQDSPMNRLHRASVSDENRDADDSFIYDMRSREHENGEELQDDSYSGYSFEQEAFEDSMDPHMTRGARDDTDVDEITQITFEDSVDPRVIERSRTSHRESTLEFEDESLSSADLGSEGLHNDIDLLAALNGESVDEYSAALEFTGRDTIRSQLEIEGLEEDGFASESFNSSMMETEADEEACFVGQPRDFDDSETIVVTIGEFSQHKAISFFPRIGPRSQVRVRVQILNGPAMDTSPEAASSFVQDEGRIQFDYTCTFLTRYQDKLHRLICRRLNVTDNVDMKFILIRSEAGQSTGPSEVVVASGTLDLAQKFTSEGDDKEYKIPIYNYNSSDPDTIGQLRVTVKAYEAMELCRTTA